MRELDERLVGIRPVQRQIQYQQMEFTGFAHFTVNTFTGKEWGDGDESPGIFNPEGLDAGQWVRAVKSAGMTGLILTCKHHDGFCLWPSRLTSHTVAYSPYRNGKGDIVGEVSQACREGGIKFGVYLSPWDRNNPLYGRGEEYDDYFVGQLTELLTGYGEIFECWFDGACGEGANGKKQVYDWDRYFQVIRRLQPQACISICGPDVRWCGNEGGHTRESEWSVVPKRLTEAERTHENSQQADDESFRARGIRSEDMDLGSRRALENEEELIWYPAEVDTSIRPGWFYHREEDGRVKSAQELFELYLKTVGGNATLLLNIPPNTDGLFSPEDVEQLEQLGRLIKNSFSVNIGEQAVFKAESKAGFEIENVKRDGYDSYFTTEDYPKSCEIQVDFQGEREISYVVLKENIALSQRIEGFRILDHRGGEIYRGTTVGYKKIARLAGPVTTRGITIIIDDYRVAPTLSFIGIY